jgi:hypothetical protein
MLPLKRWRMVAQWQHIIGIIPSSQLYAELPRKPQSLHYQRAPFSWRVLASRDRRSENVRILPVVVAELELSHIEQPVFLLICGTHRPCRASKSTGVIMEKRTPRITVVEHASEQGAWRIEFLAPTDRLAPFVRRFNAYAERDTAFVRRREPPSGLATLVFNLGQELRVEHPAKTTTAYPAGTAFYAGLTSTYAVTETDRFPGGRTGHADAAGRPSSAWLSAQRGWRSADRPD